MNISTGGPHLLLFERDQQLAALLGSEFQLSGYEYHTARTAVEVFDAIARHPIRLILVNLAQAATARREFWVALDTQRRGRGVQVISFHCSNLAGYGPRDPDDHSQGTLADVEIDGMLGLMNLIDAVRARVPATAVSNTSSTNSQPRLSKQTAPIPTTPPLSPQATERKLPTPPSTPSLPTNTTPTSNAASSHTFPAPNNVPHQEPHKNNFAAFAQQLSGTPAPLAKPTATTQTTYSDKIRAVLYPNQRNWSSPGSTTSSPTHENQQPQSTPNPAPVPPPPSTPAPAASSVLQRLANGQAESSLAQLSRLVQEHKTLAKNNVPHETQHQQQSTEFDSVTHQTLHKKGTASSLPGTPQPPAEHELLLRASPIQGLPVERPANGQVGFEGSRRLDESSHIEQQQSIPGKVAPFHAEGEALVKEETNKVTKVMEEQLDDRRERGKYALIEQTKAEIQKILNESVDSGAGTAPSHEMLLDIMQSFPPMPSPPQAVQPQVLNGRATRSLGSVLLAGHLVPQSRLEVAQNIQRMLRGVDLNYQLGEILLMFKLLTPDQLLAASLVSYGLITTSQISALGRIRQELHSIGLEYDLENLLILFRILTPEQLREVRSGWQ